MARRGNKLYEMISATIAELELSPADRRKVAEKFASRLRWWHSENSNSGYQFNTELFLRCSMTEEEKAVKDDAQMEKVRSW